MEDKETVTDRSTDRPDRQHRALAPSSSCWLAVFLRRRRLLPSVAAPLLFLLPPFLEQNGLRGGRAGRQAIRHTYLACSLNINERTHPQNDSHAAAADDDEEDNTQLPPSVL